MCCVSLQLSQQVWADKARENNATVCSQQNAIIIQSSFSVEKACSQVRHPGLHTKLGMIRSADKNFVAITLQSIL